LGFQYMYGIDFNYMTTGVSVRHDGSFFPKGATDKKAKFWNENRPYSMALENPLDISQNVGAGSFRIQTVQRSFAVACKTLMAHVSLPYETNTRSILASILPVNKEMLERQLLKRRDRPLEAKRRHGDGETDRRQCRSSNNAGSKRSKWR
jgi:non-canonical poly(A) RNA polymerase PAPD5/7